VVLAVTWTLVDSWITGLTAAAPEATSAPPGPSATAPAPPAVAERRSITPSR
jgi:hypothetical protein